MKSDSAGRISDYRELSDLPKTMVRLLAINIAPCRLYVVLKCLNDLGYINKKTGRPFQAHTIQPVQNDLIAKGLLLKSIKGISCSESIRKHAVYDTLMEDAFPDLARRIQQYNLIPRYNTDPILKNQKAARDFQISLFCTDAMVEIDEIPVADWVALFPKTLADPFRPEIIEKINPDIRFAALSNLLNVLTNTLEPAEEVVAYINEKYLIGRSDFASLSPLFFYYQACGDTISAGAALNRLDETKFSAEKHCYLGWLTFIQGGNGEALDHFNAALKLLKRKTRKRKLFFTGYIALFHLLCLLRAGENTHFNQALEYLDIAEKNSYPLFDLMRNFKAVFSEQLGLPAHDQFDIGLYEHDLTPLDMFMVILPLSWVDQQRAKARIPLLNRARDKAEKNGYPWLAAELSTLLASLGHAPKKNAETAARLHEKCKTVSFVNMVKNRPKWEKRLNGLLAITAAEQTTAPDRPADQRLIWLFSHSETYNYWQITPRMQKKNKKGGWTKGRPVALKNLHDNHHDMPGLTGQDHRICQNIKEEYYRTSWRYGKTEYLFDSQRTLPALVDHPLLFLQDSPGVNVELVITEPEIRITRKNGKLKLVLFPTPQSEAGIQVVRDTPTRFKVIRFSEKHQEISDYLGEGLSIPKKGEKLAREVADALSAVVTVQSDLETTQKIKTIAADSRPHAHITPYKAGVQLEFLVKPFGDDGSSFRPGRGGKNVLTEIKGKRVQAARDFAGEKRQQQAVIQDCPTLDRLAKMDNQWQAEDPEDSLELLLELKECGDDVVMEWPRGEKLTVRREVSLNNLSMYIRKERDWFKATGTLAIDDATSLDLRRLLDMLSRATGRFIPLDDGTFLAITGQLRKRLSELRAFSDGHGKG
ncbi:MAG: hypothetical protein U9Q05_06895, partial [Thermodesulfobacteriota bacterium]|nr:hypothetical protein [Thermodesulfobacteriota bacterium]